MGCMAKALQSQRHMHHTHATCIAVAGPELFGIAMGVRLQRAGIEFTIYEKSDEIGGTSNQPHNPQHSFALMYEPPDAQHDLGLGLRQLVPRPWTVRWSFGHSCPSGPHCIGRTS